MKKTNQKGFTLLEMLLVIGIIVILAGITIIAINPGKQLADTRNAERIADVNTIINAVYQYSIDNDGILPEDIGENRIEICKTDAENCDDLVDFSVLTDNELYLISIPIDPNNSSENGTGYEISKSSSGRITVFAPHAENEENIQVTK